MSRPAPAVRPPRRADIDTIVDYHHRCWLASFRPLVEPEVMAFIEARDRADVAAAWDERLAPEHPAIVTVAIDDDDQPIGHVMTIDDELVHLFIDPELHGHGVGRALLAVGEEQLRAGGHRDVHLHTLVGNTPAISLYLATGWTLTDETHLETLPNGSSYTEHVLRKRLG